VYVHAPMLAPLLSLAVLTVAAPTYSDLSADAKTVRNLGRLLEGYLEDCTVQVPDFDRAACTARVRAAREKVDGRRLEVEVEVEGLIHFSGWDKRKKAYRLHLVPLFDERGLGMSVGHPKRLDAQGRPVLKNIPIWVKRDEGEPEVIFKRRLRRGMVRLQLLVQPKRAWRLKPRDGDALRGMEVGLVGLRLYPARGNKVLAEQTYERR